MEHNKIKRDNNSILTDNILTHISNIDILNYEYVTTFEKKLSDYVNINNVVCVSNGTSALLLGMIALGLKENDEIIIPSYSYPSALTISKYLKLNIKFCDIKYDTLCMDPDKLKMIISKDTKAVIFIEHLGYCDEDLIKVKNICDEYNTYLIEDSAQSLGQINKNVNKMGGTIGEFGIYSFSGTKLLRSSEGGCLITNNNKISDRVKILRGINGIGNYTMSPLVSKILNHQLDNINNILNKRKRIQNIYKKFINIVSNNNESVHAVAYVSDKANTIYNMLRLKDIETRYKYYPTQNLYISNKIYENYIELPQSFDLTELDIKYICDIIKNAENLKFDSKLGSLLNRIK
jgi:dTDP-4-amino-4,6-dideoxygalactose transaminase